MSDAHLRIKERLSDTKDRLDALGLESRVYTHEYKAEVDGEIAVMVPRGVQAWEVSARLEECFQTEPHGLSKHGFWYGIGARLSIHKDEAEDRSGSARVRGMDDLAMYYRRPSTARMIDSFSQQQKVMIPGAEAKYRRKVEIVYIRLNWNKDDEKPSR